MKELIRNKMNDTDLGNVVGGNKPEEKAPKKKQPKIEKVPVLVPRGCPKRLSQILCKLPVAM